ncbi:FAD-dependent oxidoreductase [Candidatus Woesearchaeota archaeon]|nr:FAD-dependent oxidoreductase [Candidatus Woesearchaeota archaeon]
MYDVLIVGAGAAGLTAAIYTCRKNLKTAVISLDIGGQTNLTNHIENYPGVNAMPGPQLMQKFQENALNFGAEIIPGKVIHIDKKDDLFEVQLANGEKNQTKVVILAFGKVARSLNIPGEEKFFGRGVSTCATCDSPLYKNKIAAVVGGGNSGVEAALELASIAKKVYLIHRHQKLKADEITVKKVEKQPNVEIILNSQPTEIIGDKFVTSIIVEDVKTKEKKGLHIDGVFVEIGYVVDTSMVKHLAKLNKRNEIIITDKCETSCPGLFAAGDVTTMPFKQTVISAGEGAKAALQAYYYLTGGKGSTIDWT